MPGILTILAFARKIPTTVWLIAGLGAGLLIAYNVVYHKGYNDRIAWEHAETVRELSLAGKAKDDAQIAVPALTPDNVKADAGRIGVGKPCSLHPLNTVDRDCRK
jgi:hypothetical protein